MNKRTRRTFSADFKAKVALEAVREAYTLSELAQKYEVSPVMISRWKSELLANVATVFQTKSEKKASQNVDVETLYSQIGQLKVENDFLKKVRAKLRA